MANSDSLPWEACHGQVSASFVNATTTAAIAHDCKFVCVWPAMYVLPLGRWSRSQRSEETIWKRSSNKNPDSATSHRVFSGSPLWRRGAMFKAT
jgi:hypothetical protein